MNHSCFLLRAARVFICALGLACASTHADAPVPALPEYQPDTQIRGVLRSRGSDEMAPMIAAWQKGFQRYHPQIEFADTLIGSSSAIYGLETRTADIAFMGRPLHPYERYGTYERSWIFPVEIEVATGSADAPHRSPAYAVMVHKSNPLTKLTLQQLDGIFGAPRSGGWDGLVWNTKAARTAESDIRTWGQLGLKGAWAKRPVHVYGPPLLGAGNVTLFQTLVMHGAATWNEDLREYADRQEMMAQLARDPSGIAYTALGYRTSDTKPLAIAARARGEFVELTPNTVADRSYPLARPVYLYYTIDTASGQLADPRVDPKVREFVRYILSRQGQEDVAREGSFLPLTAKVAAVQRDRLESREDPAERKKRQ